MLDILNLAFPFFGLILIGFACGKLRKIPDAGLAWMNFFILYVALPALFFRILSKTPFEQLAQINFVKATVLATAGAFFLSFLIGLMISRGRVAEATLAGRGRRLRQRRLHGAWPGAGDAGAGGRCAGGADLLLRRAADLRPDAAADGLQRRLHGRVRPRAARCGAQHRPQPVADLGRASARWRPPITSSRRLRSSACWRSCTLRRRPARCSRSASRWRCGRCSAGRPRCPCCRP